MEHWPIKDPVDVKDYGIDWETLLGSDEVINEATWDAPGLTVNSSYISDKVTVVWLAGGALGSTYQVSCTITTNAGRTINRGYLLRVRDR